MDVDFKHKGKNYTLQLVAIEWEPNNPEKGKISFAYGDEWILDKLTDHAELEMNAIIKERHGQASQGYIRKKFTEDFGHDEAIKIVHNSFLRTKKLFVDLFTGVPNIETVPGRKVELKP